MITRCRNCANQLVFDPGTQKLVCDRCGSSFKPEDGYRIMLGDELADLAGTFNSVVRSDSFLKCFTELDGGAVDAVLVDAPVAASYAAEHDGFVILDEKLGGEQYGICFRSGDQELCDEVEGAIQELVADGTYKQIAEKDEYKEIINSLIFLQ